MLPNTTQFLILACLEEVYVKIAGGGGGGNINFLLMITEFD